MASMVRGGRAGGGGGAGGGAGFEVVNFGFAAEPTMSGNTRPFV